MDDLHWLGTIQSNENGSSRGEFNCDTNQWEATVYIKAINEILKMSSISHKKVAKWLSKTRKKYGLN